MIAMKNLIHRLARTSATRQQQVLRGQSAELPFAYEKNPDIAVPNRQVFIDRLLASCRLQLEILKKSLGLNTVVLLWPGPVDGQLTPYGWATDSEHFLEEPIQAGHGVIGVLKEHRQLFLAPLRAQSPDIPYYPSNELAGSFMAVRLELNSLVSLRPNGAVILCADRLSSAAWTEQERNIFLLTADQLSLQIDQAREFYLCDRQRHVYLRAFDGLQKLNAALGLESAFAAIVAAVLEIVPADFVAISLVERGQHRINYVVGENAPKLAGQSFPVEQGLVGQVLKYGRTLPEVPEYQGTSPVFSNAHLFADYRSLMIVPLIQDKRAATGALVVAARGEAVFHRNSREMLEMLANQMAVKIELAQSHEQINRLATVDTLTGIANRRAYQRGFEAMLERAARSGGSLYLILCDIDYFKRINDRFGHPFGDEVLQQVARLFERVVRSGDLAARTGGEEFAILLEGSDEKGAWKVSERLRKLVAELQLKTPTEVVEVTISLGIAAYPKDAGSLEKLVSLADQALYAAKRNGRNRTVLWKNLAAQPAIGD